MGTTCYCFSKTRSSDSFKMKLVLALLSCCAVVSSQHGYIPPWAYWHPNHYMNPIGYPHPGNYFHPGAFQNRFRSGLTDGPIPLTFNDAYQIIPDGRQIFPTISNLNLRLYSTSTKTAYVTTVTSATTLIDGGTCVSYALVKDAAAALLTCRKKRELAHFNDMLKEAALREQLSPTQVAPVEVSAVTDLQSVSVIPEIVSSQSEYTEDSFRGGENRAFFLLTSVTTVTSTVTSAVLSTSTTTKKLGTNFAAAAALTCIPPGFFIC